MDPVNQGSSSSQPNNIPQRQHRAAPHSSPGSEQIAAWLLRMRGESASARGSSYPSVGPIRTSRHGHPATPSGLHRIPGPGLERTAARLCRWSSGETTSAGTSRTLTPGPAQASHRRETSRTRLVVLVLAYQNIPRSYNMSGNRSGHQGSDQMLPSHEVDFQLIPLINNQPLPPRGGDRNRGSYMARRTVPQSRSSQLPSSLTSNMYYQGGFDPIEQPIHSTHGPALQQPNNEMVSQPVPPTSDQPLPPRRGDRSRGSHMVTGTMAPYRSSQLPSTSNLLYTYSGLGIDPFAKLVVSIRGTPLQHPVRFKNEISVDGNGNIYIVPAAESRSQSRCPVTSHTHCSSSDINPLANPIHSTHEPSHQQPFPASRDRKSPSLGANRNIRRTTASENACPSTSIAPSRGTRNRRSYCEDCSTPLVYPETMTPTPAAVAFAESWIPADPLPLSHVQGGHQCAVTVQQSSSTADAVPRAVPRPNLHLQRILREDELAQPRSIARPSNEPNAEVSDSELQC